MAKKKVKVSMETIDDGVIESREDIRNRIIKDIEKDFGKGIVVNGHEILERPRLLIPVSPAINQITGGGIPEGSWVVLSGKEKIGKTVTALHFAKRCQKPEWGGRNIYFLNVEGRLKKRDLYGTPGLDFDKIHVIESTEDKILTAEDYLRIASNIIYTDKKCVIIIDSVSQLCEERVQTGGVGTQTRGSGGILVSQFTAQMGPVVNVKNSIVICILQHRNNTSGYGGPIEKGGWAIQYQVDVKLIAQGGPQLLSLVEGGNPYGQIVTWKCTATGVNFPPNRKCESYVRYGEGIDETSELIVDAKDTGLISGVGYLTFDFLEKYINELGYDEWNEDTIKELGAKPHGLEKARQKLKDNPQWMEWLEKEINYVLV